MKKIIGILLVVISFLFFIAHFTITSFVILNDFKIVNPLYFLGLLSLILGIIFINSKDNKTLEQKVQGVVSFKTEKGSVYTYLPDGRTQRYKAAEQALKEPHNITVFIPDLMTMQKALAQSPAKQFLGKSDEEYEEYVQELVYSRKYKYHIINKEGKIIESLEKVQNEQGPLYMTIEVSGKVEGYLPVSKVPKRGYYVFQTTKSGNERRTHLGHKISEINYK